MRTWEFTIELTDGRGSIRDTASGVSETDARRVIKARYPGCNILASREIR